MSEEWWANVGPLIEALEELGISPVEWASAEDPCDMAVFEPLINPDPETFVAHPKLLEDHIRRMGRLDFACGYLQATGNLTGKTWAEQFQSAGYL